MTNFLPEGWLMDTAANRSLCRNPAGLWEAFHTRTILEARAILCTQQHDLVVDFGFCRGITAVRRRFGDCRRSGAGHRPALPRGQAGLLSHREHRAAERRQPLSGPFPQGSAAAVSGAVHPLADCRGCHPCPGHPSGGFWLLCGHRLRHPVDDSHRLHLGFPHFPSCRPLFCRTGHPCGRLRSRCRRACDPQPQGAAGQLGGKCRPVFPGTNGVRTGALSRKLRHLCRACSQPCRTC